MIFTLQNSEQAHTVLKNLWPKIKETLQAGKQLRLEVKKATRNNEQNRLLHAVLSDIANQVEWSGKKFNEIAKVLSFNNQKTPSIKKNMIIVLI